MIRRLALLCALSIGPALLPQEAAAVFQTRFEQVNECKIRVIVPLELYTVPVDTLPLEDDGSKPDYAEPDEAATEAYARQLEQNAESMWNGPSAAEAETLAGTMDVERQPGQSASQAIQANASRIREQWQRYAREAGADANCTWVDCCGIEVDVRVRVRDAGDPPTEGYHQIGIMGPGYRSHVTIYEDPSRPEGPIDWNNPDHVHDGTERTTKGIWANRGSGARAPAAHEIGHLMGLDDEYDDVRNRAGEKVSVVREGHHHDLMATNFGFPFQDALESIVKASGFDCDCCEDSIEYTSIMRDYALTVQNAGDAIVTCDIEAIRRQIEQARQLRRRLMASDSRPREKAISAARIDSLIARLQQALENCGGNTRTDAGVVDLSWDSTEWCEYAPEGPTEVPVTPIPALPELPPFYWAPGPAVTPSPDPTPGQVEQPGHDQTPREDGDPLNPGWAPPEENGHDDPYIRPSDGEEDEVDPVHDSVELPSVPVPGDQPPVDPVHDTVELPIVPVYVKARADVLDQEGNVDSQETPGQVIRINPPSTIDPDLPGPNTARDDTGHDEGPRQCVTDDNGDCRIDAPVSWLDMPWIDEATRALLGGDPGPAPQPAEAPPAANADQAGDGQGVRAGMSVQFEPAAGYRAQVQARQRESVLLFTNSQLSDEDQQAIRDSLFDGALSEEEQDAIVNSRPDISSIDITGLRLPTGFTYRIDWNVKVDLGDMDFYVGDGQIEDNVCRDKQPGPPQGRDAPKRETGEFGDLPGQSLALPIATPEPGDAR